MISLTCYNCYKSFDDQHMPSTVCYICSMPFCYDCKSYHTHNYFNEHLVDRIFGFNYVEFDESIEELIGYRRSLIHSLTKTFWEENNKDYRKLQVNIDYKCFNLERHMIKERFRYQLVEIIIRRKFCKDILMCILKFL